jgi:Pectate lyase superfamily protein
MKIIVLAAFSLFVLPNSGMQAAPGAGIPELNWKQRSDWINVCAAGAKGDGVADDTAAIQSVLDHLSDKPKDRLEKQHVVYFPPGRYRITRTLEITESTGAWLVGNGKSTTIVWDGEVGGRMYWSNGCRYVCYEGLTWDGRGKAAVLCGHQSQSYYETWVRYIHCAFLNARDHGIVVGLGESKSPSAEMWFRNCLFDHCGEGVALLAPNDYDNIFDGCEFIQCGTGIHGVRGNWQIRGCRFEESRVADVKQDNISHGAAIRFCVSRGSRRFLETCRDANPMPMQIEGCRIDRWGATDGAIVIGHPGPLTMFDCVFSRAPGSGPAVVLGEQRDFGQSLVESCNATPSGVALLKTGGKASVTHIPAGGRAPLLPGLDDRFLSAHARIPGRVFDARVDFGAKGDGKTDDTGAIQNCIAAARRFGRDAVAYLPGGDYVLSKTLQVGGADYFVGGIGFGTRLFWAGEKGGVAIHVEMPQRIVLENVVFGPRNERFTRIRHSATGVSSALYDQIEVNHWNELPPDGLLCEKLPKGAQVRLGMFSGNLRLRDCGQADVFALIHYGPATIEGSELPKSGFTGFMFHNAALSRPGDPLYALTVRDNQDLVVADYYMEQSARYLLCEGGKRRGVGHVTLGASKLSTKDAQSVVVHDYEGRIWISGADAQCDIDLNKTLSLTHEGTRPLCFVAVGNSWCEFEPVVNFGQSASFVRLGNVLRGKRRAPLPDVVPPDGLGEAAAGLDDFRRLGAVYLKEVPYKDGRHYRERGRPRR